MEQTSRTFDVPGWSASYNDKAARTCKHSRKNIVNDSIYCFKREMWVSTQRCRTCDYFGV